MNKRKIKKRSSSDKVNATTKTKSPKERSMNKIKYIGMDVHMAMTVIAVLNSTGKQIAEAIIETKASTILDFISGQRGILHVTFEEGTQAAWLYDLIRPHVSQVTVCKPPKINKSENKADKIDARRLAELLRTNGLKAVYHGEHSTQALKELIRSYISIVHDNNRVKTRLKALFRGRGISCSGDSVYSLEDRDHWRRQINTPTRRLRADRLWKQLDYLTELSNEAEKDLIKESRKHSAIKILRSIPGIGPLRSAIILGIGVTPHRFRTVKQFWSYCGLAVRTHATGEYELVEGRIQRSKKQTLIRGLNRNYNRALKEVFKGAALSTSSGPWKEQFEAKVKAGKDPSLVRLTLARKISSITLALWKKGERYDAKKLKFKHAA
jgi:transposase